MVDTWGMSLRGRRLWVLWFVHEVSLEMDWVTGNSVEAAWTVLEVRLISLVFLTPRKAE